MRNADRQVFDAFVDELAKFVDQHVTAVTEADQSDILVKQGRAQMARSLLKILRECDQPKPQPQQAAGAQRR